MKRMFEILLVALILLLAASCATNAAISLTPVEVKGSVAENTEVSSSIRKDNLYVGINGGAMNGNRSLFFATIGNEGPSPITFRDSDLEIFVGDRLKNQWKSLGPWSGQQCLMKAADSARRMHFWVGVAGLLDVVAFSFDTYLSMDSSGSWYQETYFDPFAAAFAYSLALEDQLELAEINKMNLDYLKDNLLFSKTLASGESYSGLIMTKAGNRYPNYKFVYGKDDSRSMVFERSDAEELRHPWRERKVHTSWSMFYTYGVNAPSSFLFSGNSPAGVNFYTGFSWKLPEVPEDYVKGSTIHGGGTDFTAKDFVPSGENLYGTRIGFPFGLTIKGSPHGWLMVGADFGFYDGVYRKGTFQKGSESYGPCWYGGLIGAEAKFDMTLQTGLNLVFNFLDFNAMVHYSPFTKILGYSLGGGFAF